MSTSDSSAEGWLQPEEIETHDRRMRYLARSLLLDREAGDDVVQDAWLAFLRRPPRRREAVVSWLRRVVGNLARRERRDASTRSRHERAASRPERRSDSAEALLEWIELQRRLQELIGSLEEPARTALVLRFFGNLSPAQIASRQGVAVSTVRLRISNGLERLRKGLDSHYREGRTGWRSALIPILGLGGIGSGMVAAGAGSTEGSIFGSAAAGTPAAKYGALSQVIAIGGMTVTKKSLLGVAIGCCLLAGGGVYLTLRSSEHSSDAARERLSRLTDENARLQGERDDRVPSAELRDARPA